MLKKLREVRDAEPKNDSRLREEELSGDRHGIPSSNLPTRTRLAALDNSTEGVGQRFQQKEGQMRHESRDVHGKKTSQKNYDALEYTRGNLARFNGALDNAPSPSSIGAVQAKTKRLGEVALGGVGATKAGGRFDGITEAIDNAPRLSAIRNDRLNTDTSRSIYVTPSGRPETEDNVLRLSNSLRKPVTIPTALVERDDDEFASGGRTEDVERAVERGGYRDYTRENIREKSGRETVKPRLVEHNDVRTRPVANAETFESSTSHRNESVQDAVTKRKGLSTRAQATKNDSHGLLRKSRSLAQEETSSSKEGVLDKRTEKDHKESEGNVRARERKTKDTMGLSSSKTSRGGGPKLFASHSGDKGHRTTKEGETLFPAKSRSRVNKCGRSSKDSDGHGGGKKGKENMRPQGVVRDRKGTREENVDKKGRTRDTVIQSRKEVESDSVDERNEGTEASQIGVYFFSVNRKFRLKAFLKLRRLRLITGRLDDAVSICKNKKKVLISAINI